ncbi:MAG: dihydroorotase [Clostridia bacterium]|nr:dihydroorotase [Clostridia bacterium]
MRILLQGANVFAQNQLQEADVLLQEGRVVSVQRGIPVSASDRVVSLSDSFVITPGFADVHVHLREPGFSYKETIRTGTMAGAAAGYTDLCAMPNLDPVPDTPDHLRVQLDCIQKDALVHVYPYGALTLGRKGMGECADYAGMLDHVIGFSDDGSGIQDEGLMLEIMNRIRPLGKPIAAHCEYNHLLNGGYIHDGQYAHEHGHRGISSASEYEMIDRDLRLVEKTGCRYHVCHVSARESVELIRQAKRKGLPVTCETGPHYLLLSDQDLREEGRFKMNPPLRSPEDRDALLNGLADGTIDVIATDHAPHSREEKAKGLSDSAMGITGLETAFPVLYTKLVKTGLFSLEFLLDKMITAPRKIFGIPERFREGEWMEGNLLDLDASYTIDADSFLSMGKATPFDGWAVSGKNRATWIHGNVVWTDREELK